MARFAPESRTGLLANQKKVTSPILIITENVACLESRYRQQ